MISLTDVRLELRSIIANLKEGNMDLEEAMEHIEVLYTNLELEEADYRAAMEAEFNNN